MACELGFYGKLPSHGDFIRRRVPSEFLGVWDGWLQRAVADSRRTLGDEWLDTYLTSPIWRFLLTPGVCGVEAYTGVLMPSVDAVGRYFPLTLVAPLPEGTAPLGLVLEQARWFERLEALALSVLHGDAGFDLARFDEDVAALGRDLAPHRLDGAVRGPGGGPACYELPDLASMAGSLLGVLGACLGERAGAYSLWWTEGSDRVSPCWTVTPGLPDGAAFTATLDGRWARHGWQHQALAWREDEPATTAREAAVPPRLRSSGLSHAGHVRDVNEDAFIELPAQGLWAVADGVGGQEAGDEASRTVVEALRRVEGGADLQARVNAARQRLAEVNARLQHLAERPVAPVTSASTVAALLTGAAGCAYVWAGDSRIYRLRAGELTACTRDHSLVEGLVAEGRVRREEARVHPQSNVITRAVGGGAELELDVGYGDLRPGDRFLLCTDGVHGAVTEAELAQVLARADAAAACRGVIDLVLSREARDNLTAVVVDVLDTGAETDGDAA